jgi:hypothetical protein
MPIASRSRRALVVPLLAALALASLAPSTAHAAAATTTYGINPDPPTTNTARAVILGGLVADGTFTALQAGFWLRTGHPDRTVAALQLVSSGLVFAYSASLLRRDGADGAIIGLDVWTALLCTQSLFTLFGAREVVPPLEREHDVRLGASLLGAGAPGLGLSGTW